MNILIVGEVPMDETDSEFPFSKNQLIEVCQALGKALGNANHTYFICSPHEHSADVEFVKGVALCEQANSDSNEPLTIQIHCLGNQEVIDSVNALQAELTRLRGTVDALPVEQRDIRLARRYHLASSKNDAEWIHFSNFICKQFALDKCDAVLSFGGAEFSATDMLLTYAEELSKPIIPVPVLGGVSARRYALVEEQFKEALGEDIACFQLNTPSDFEQFDAILKRVVHAFKKKKKKKSLGFADTHFFISYASEEQGYVDQIEALLRRDKFKVSRDEDGLRAGDDHWAKISEWIEDCDVFIALWSKHYALSSYCADELELGMARHESEDLPIWLLRADETELIPRGIRKMKYENVGNRSEVIASVKGYISKLSDPHNP